MNRFVLITGCSGGGKSSLLTGLARRGHNVVAEPGRRIVAEERAGDGRALPWVDAAAFARRAVDMARADLRGALGLTFFDRGLVDAAAALAHAGEDDHETSMAGAARYNDVFLAPPWAEIFIQDSDRKHDFSSAVAEYERIEALLNQLGYKALVLPKVSVEARADFVLAALQ